MISRSIFNLGITYHELDKILEFLEKHNINNAAFWKLSGYDIIECDICYETCSKIIGYIRDYQNWNTTCIYLSTISDKLADKLSNELDIDDVEFDNLFQFINENNINDDAFWKLTKDDFDAYYVMEWTADKILKYIDVSKCKFEQRL